MVKYKKTEPPTTAKLLSIIENDYASSKLNEQSVISAQDDGSIINDYDEDQEEDRTSRGNKRKYRRETGPRVCKPIKTEDGNVNGQSRRPRTIKNNPKRLIKTQQNIETLSLSQLNASIIEGIPFEEEGDGVHLVNKRGHLCNYAPKYGLSKHRMIKDTNEFASIINPLQIKKEQGENPKSAAVLLECLNMREPRELIAKSTKLLEQTNGLATRFDKSRLEVNAGIAIIQSKIKSMVTNIEQKLRVIIQSQLGTKPQDTSIKNEDDTLQKANKQTKNAIESYIFRLSEQFDLIERESAQVNFILHQLESYQRPALNLLRQHKSNQISIKKIDYTLREFQADATELKQTGANNSYDELIGQFENTGVIGLYSKSLELTDFFRIETQQGADSLKFDHIRRFKHKVNVMMGQEDRYLIDNDIFILEKREDDAWQFKQIQQLRSKFESGITQGPLHVIYGHPTYSMVQIYEFFPDRQGYYPVTVLQNLRRHAPKHKNDGAKMFKAYPYVENTYFCITSRRLVKFSSDLSERTISYDTLFYGGCDGTFIHDYQILDSTHLAILLSSQNLMIIDQFTQNIIQIFYSLPKLNTHIWLCPGFDFEKRPLMIVVRDAQIVTGTQNRINYEDIFRSGSICSMENALEGVELIGGPLDMGNVNGQEDLDSSYMLAKQNGSGRVIVVKFHLSQK